MRFGLFGTGFWAADVHAAALSASDDVDFVGVWGRDPAKAAAVADRYHVQVFRDVDQLLERVDAIAVALPPDVQAGIAARAAAAGKHMLLDKPLALTSQQADQVVTAADASGVSSAIFFTLRFLPEIADWLQQLAGRSWHGVQATWLASMYQPGNPFAGSPWRQAKGALWDIAPHTLSVTVPLVGRVERVASATRDADGTVHLVLLHESGRSSVQSVSHNVPEPASILRVAAYGEPGWTTMPERDTDAVTALSVAVNQLLDDAAAGRSESPCGVHFGAEVVRILEQAESLLPAPAFERERRIDRNDG